LRWTVAVLVVFVLGIAATWVAQVQPKVDEIAQLRTDLQVAQTELERLRPLEAENEQLQAEANVAGQRLAVLGSLVDVTSAQVAMLMGDPEAARSELAGTAARLTELRGLLDPAGVAEVEAMQTRLEQVLGEVDDDAFAAQRDLEVLANNLATLDRSLASD
jgi:DNA repair ATPase RecN